MTVLGSRLGWPGLRQGGKERGIDYEVELGKTQALCP